LTNIEKLKDGQKIQIEKILDDNVTLHPEISKWRDAYRVDLKLLHSIKTQGQFQDTIFRLKRSDGEGEDLELIVGARRYLHQKLLGTKLEDIPHKVLKLSDKQAMDMAAAENFYREDLNKWEETRVIYDLLTKAKIPVKDVAKKFGYSEETIKHRRTLMKLPRSIREQFEKMDAPLGYAEPITKLSKYPEAQEKLLKEIKEGIGSRYRGIDTVDEANEFVDKVINNIKEKEALLKKYGPCPVCGSKNISKSWNREDRLTCDDCDHSWHKETKEPWKYYQLKQEAEEMGLEIEEPEEGKLKITPKDAAKLLEKQIKEKEAEENEEEEELPGKFRSIISLEALIAPIIKDNIQKVLMRGDTLEIELIEDRDLHFRGLKKDYKAGELARIEHIYGCTIEELHDYYNTRVQALG